MAEKKGLGIAERTFIMVKPDGVDRGLIGEILARFEKRGFKLIAAKLHRPPRQQLEAHYADLKNKPFFTGLIEYMLSGPVFCMVFEGLNAVDIGRAMLGTTDPFKSPIGTIRGDYALAVGRNICHGSDTVDNAQKEIELWFPEKTLEYRLSQLSMLYEGV